MDGKAHIRRTDLGDHGAVVVLDHGVNEALRLHDDVNPVVIDIEKPMRLDNFKAFIEHGCRINRDFLPHVPRGMREAIGKRHPFQFVFRLAAEGAAGRRQNEAMNVPRVLAQKRLENGAVLAVHGQNADAFFRCRPHHERAARDERFLIRKRHVFS